MVECKSEPASPDLAKANHMIIDEVSDAGGHETSRFVGADFFRVDDIDGQSFSKSVGSKHQLLRCTLISYSDVSECENHHAGCWHLPRRPSQKELHHF